VTTPVRRLHNSFSYFCDIQSLSLAHARELLHAIAERALEDTDALLEALDGHVLSIELAATYLREYYGDDHPSVITTRAKLAALLQR
jgi:hypothetical protein